MQFSSDWIVSASQDLNINSPSLLLKRYNPVSLYAYTNFYVFIKQIGRVKSRDHFTLQFVARLSLAVESSNVPHLTSGIVYLGNILMILTQSRSRFWNVGWKLIILQVIQCFATWILSAPAIRYLCNWQMACRQLFNVIYCRNICLPI